MKTELIKYIVVLSLLCPLIMRVATAQDLMAGEITTRFDSGYTYTATVTIYALDTTINRDTIIIAWGDASIDTLLKASENITNDLRVLTYQGSHVYPGDGVYNITYSGNYRIPEIMNFLSSPSGTEPLQLDHTLLISSILNSNSAVKFLSPAYDIGASGEVYSHWPGAYEPDGDSLSYGIDVPSGNGAVIPTGMSINTISGDLMWDSPMQEGYHAIRIVVFEHRSSLIISTTKREMLIKIESLTSNTLIHSTTDRDITIYPNPTFGPITLTGLRKGSTTIAVYNVLGELVHEQELNGADDTSVDLSTFPSGLYLVHLQQGQNTFRKKVIKQ